MPDSAISSPLDADGGLNVGDGHLTIGFRLTLVFVRAAGRQPLRVKDDIHLPHLPRAKPWTN